MSTRMTVHETLRAAQRGLPLPAIFGQVLTNKLTQKDETTRQSILSIIRDLANNIAGNYADCGLVAAFCPRLSGLWNGREIPIDTAIIGRGIKICNSGGDVLLYIKAPDKVIADTLKETIFYRLDKLSEEIDMVAAGKRKDIRVAGGRYNDGITNPNDPISLADDILISTPSPYHGASFGLTQNFKFQWDRIVTQSAGTEDKMIGRNPDGA